MSSKASDLDKLVQQVKIRALPHFYDDAWKKVEEGMNEEIKDCKQLESIMKLGPDGGNLGCAGLIDYATNVINDVKRARFFEKTIPFIQKLVLEMPELFPDKYLPILRPHYTESLDLTRHQAAALLACCFFSLFEEMHGGLHGPNFEPLFCFKGMGHQKVKCILHYFNRLESEGFPESGLTFHRRALKDEEIRSISAENISECTLPLTNLNLHETGGIEDAKEALQVDFANEYIGGGVLGGGCVQEEIRFMVAPECLCSLIFCPIMRSEESITIIGAERFSEYTGYARSFRWGGDCRENLPLDDKGRPASALVAIDAIVAFCSVDEKCLLEDPNLSKILRIVFATKIFDIKTLGILSRVSKESKELSYNPRHAPTILDFTFLLRTDPKLLKKLLDQNRYFGSKIETLVLKAGRFSYWKRAMDLFFPKSTKLVFKTHYNRIILLRTPANLNEIMEFLDNHLSSIEGECPAKIWESKKFQDNTQKLVDAFNRNDFNDEKVCEEQLWKWRDEIIQVFLSVRPHDVFVYLYVLTNGNIFQFYRKKGSCERL